MPPGYNVNLFKDEFSNLAGWNRQGVMIHGELTWEGTLLQDPTVIYNAGGGPLFKMWYGAMHYVGYATSSDGRTWTKAAAPAISQTLDTENLNQPSVVYKDGVWHMIYHGHGSGISRIHYATATSPDGPWAKHGVVLGPTMAWEDDYIYNSSLVYDAQAGLWKMWYTAGKIASAGGEPEFICYATAANPAGPWTKYSGNPILGPMQDGGWASLGIGGPNVRKLADGTYEMVVVGWQADYPSRGGRLTSPDGIHWTLTRSAMHHDIGVVGGPEDGMIYRQFIVNHNGVDHMYYNTKNNRPGWNETLNLATWSDNLPIIDPSKWAMTQGPEVTNGASFAVEEGRAHSLGNAPNGHMQTLQGNVAINSRDYAVSAEVTPTSTTAKQQDSVLIARATDRANYYYYYYYYYGGIASWNDKYAIGKVVQGANTMLVGVGAASEISANTTYRLKLVVHGSTIDLYDNDVLVATATDTSLAPESSYVGIENAANDGQAYWDNVSVDAPIAR